MDFYDWALAFHLLAGFSVAAALVLYSVLVIAGRRMDTLEQTRRLFSVAPVGGPLIGAGVVVSLVGGIGLRRSRSGGGRGLLKASSVIATLLVAIYVIAIWAMGAKPT